jgi:hypothetical protein
VGLEPTIPIHRDACFRDRPLIRPDDFRTVVVFKLRGLESNQRPPDSESGVTTSSNCPAASFHRRAFKVSRGSGRRIRTFIACFKDRRPTISRSPRVPCGSRTHLAGLEDRHLCRSAKGTMNTSCGGRNRTCVPAVNSRLPVPARAPPHQRVVAIEQSARPDLNRRSPGSGPGGFPDFPTRR